MNTEAAYINKAKKSFEAKDFNSCTKTLLENLDEVIKNLDQFNLLCFCLMFLKQWKRILEVSNSFESLNGKIPDFQVIKLLALCKLRLFQQAEKDAEALDLKALSAPDTAPQIINYLVFIYCAGLKKHEEIVDLALSRIHHLRPDTLEILIASADANGDKNTLAILTEHLSEHFLDHARLQSLMAKITAAEGNKGAFLKHISNLEKNRWAKGNLDLEEELAQIDSAQCSFIHTIKTGGTSTIPAFKGFGIYLNHRFVRSDRNYTGNGYYDLHNPPYVDKEVLNTTKIVTNVRNIFSFFVSYYFDARRVFYISALADDVLAASKYEFPDFVKYLADKTSGWVCRDLVFFKCFSQPDGELVVDWVNRMETINDDLKALSDTLGMNREKQVEHKNKNVSEDYKNFYDDKTIGLVHSTWADDIRLFGFEFDGSYSSNALLHRDVSNMKGKVIYSIEDKTLVIQ